MRSGIAANIKLYQTPNDDDVILSFLKSGAIDDPLRYPLLSRDHWNEFKGRLENQNGRLFSLRFHVVTGKLTHVFCGSLRAPQSRSPYVFFNLFGSACERSLIEILDCNIYSEFPEFQTIANSEDVGFTDALSSIGFEEIEKELYLRLAVRPKSVPIVGSLHHVSIDYEPTGEEMLTEVADIYNQAFQKDISYVPKTPKDFAKGVLFPDRRLIVAKFFEKPVSMIILERDAQVLYIDTVATRPDFQRRGVANYLLQSVLNDPITDGEVRLQVHESNNSALSLYEKSGFERFKYKVRLKLNHIQQLK